MSPAPWTPRRSRCSSVLLPPNCCVNRSPSSSNTRRPAVTVSQREVDALRREGEAQGLDSVDGTLKTLAEIVGYQLVCSRGLGASQAEALDHVELLVRSTDQWRESVREARDILVALGYG